MAENLAVLLVVWKVETMVVLLVALMVERKVVWKVEMMVVTLVVSMVEMRVVLSVGSLAGK